MSSFSNSKKETQTYVFELLQDIIDYKNFPIESVAKYKLTLKNEREKIVIPDSEKKKYYTTIRD